MRVRVGYLAMFAFTAAAAAACGPEAQLFDKITGKEAKPPRPRSVTVESSFYPEDGSGKSDAAPTCAEEYYKDKLCFEEQRVRFTVTTAGTPLAPIGLEPAAAVTLFATSDAIVSADACMTPLDPSLVPGADVAQITVSYKAVQEPNEDEPGETLIFESKQAFVYSCDARLVHVIANEGYGFAHGTSVTVSYAAPHGSYVATSPLFIGTGSQAVTRDVPFATAVTTAGGPRAADACAEGLEGDAGLVSCRKEKLVNFVYDVAAYKGVALGAAPVDAVTVAITPDGVTAVDACFGAGVAPNAGRLAVDWITTSDADDSSVTSHLELPLFGCETKKINFKLDAAMVAGNRYELKTTFESTAASFFATSGPLRGAPELDTPVDVPLTPAYVRGP